jgi:hypothetical protein
MIVNKIQPTWTVSPSNDGQTYTFTPVAGVTINPLDLQKLLRAIRYQNTAPVGAGNVSNERTIYFEIKGVKFVDFDGDQGDAVFPEPIIATVKIRLTQASDETLPPGPAGNGPDKQDAVTAATLAR